MFFAGHSTLGVCPAASDGRQHDPTGSRLYMIQMYESNVAGQTGWAWCWKCEGLYFNDHDTKGVCPRDGAGHDGSESGVYILHGMGTLQRGETEWRWCRNCEGLFFFGGAATGGACEATGGGAHNPTDSGNYMLRRAGEHTFDRDQFVDRYQGLFRDPLSVARRRALLGFLDFAERDTDITDLRWIAYMLATARHEVGAAFLPIRESQCIDGRTPVCTPLPGNARKYGEPVTCPNLTRRPPIPCPHGRSSHTYYGRGYVQLTHASNYRTMGARVGLLEDFVHDPDVVLEPFIAYEVMSIGMREGRFTSRKLSDFINDAKLDYLNARAIVNPGDKKTFVPIARAAERFQTALELSLR